jgi:acetyl coenzyme A synthetase (ADP forming)-like protein
VNTEGSVVAEPSRYRAEGILQDGSPVLIRALGPGDKPLLLELFGQLSGRSVYFRFFRAKARLTDGEVSELTDLDFVKRVALAAIIQKDGREHIVGVGRYAEVNEAAPRRAEVAFAVADDDHNRGIGTLLLENLASVARANGVLEFEADILGENSQMVKVFDDSGFRVKRSLDSGVIHLSIATESTGEAVEAQFRRERAAAAQSVRSFLAPRSVAVVGASREAGSIGAALVSNLKQCGFTGAIYPVNPKAGEIDGLKAYPGVAAIGKPVDMALISVPAPMVEQAVRDCASAGVRSVVVISSGFGEVSSEGREIERRLREFVRSSGMRMVGPNCMGILNTDSAISLNATFVPSWPPPGNIGVVSQSGALGYVILNHLKNLDAGVSTFVSVGNKADVSGNDILSYWAEDPATAVGVLYLESFGNPRRFGRIAPEIARRKPIIALKAGRSGAGSRAASSHSAALASPDVAVDALFEQAGVIRVDTLEQLLDVALLMSSQPVPAGPRVGIITNGGGPGILLADACEANGLTLPELGEHTKDRLRSLLPPQATVSNPVDMLPSSTGEQYADAIRLVASDPGVDSVIVIYIPPQLHPPEVVGAAIARAAGEVPPEKPVLTVVMWPEGPPRSLGTGPRGRLPSYGFPENAAYALSAAERYGRWRKRPRGIVPVLEPGAQAAVRAVIDRALTTESGPVWLQPADLAMVLQAAEIQFADTRQVLVDEALDTAERMGFPLVLKVHSDRVIHKSDVGGVITGLTSHQDVASALARLAQRMQRIGIPLERVLLQREVSGGVEALAGVTMDPIFGPVVVCGLGGVLVELLKDVSFRLTPVSDTDAEEMVARLRSGRLLDGYRGSAPADREALVRTIQRVSALAELVPELIELDLNPIKVLDSGKGAVVVDARMKISLENQPPGHQDTRIT